MFIIALSVVLASNILYYYFVQQKLEAGLSRKATELSVEVAHILQPEATLYQDLLTGKISDRDAEAPIENKLRSMQLSLSIQGVKNIYTLALHEKHLHVVGDPDPAGGLPLSVIDTSNLEIKLKTISEKQAYASMPYNDAYGTWVSGYAPIFSSDNAVVAIVGIDLTLGSFDVVNEVLRQNILINILVAMLLSMAVSFIASQQLTKPLKALAGGLEKIRDEQFNVELDVSSSDELGHICKTFNDMASGLREKKHMSTLLYQAVSPKIAEALLQGKVSAEGELVEGTVLFADVRGFTALSETLSAQEVITLMNDYLEILVPIITSNNGVIDKFVGDEIMALFGIPDKLTNDPLSAVQAAIKMQEAVKELNIQRSQEGKPTAEIGIGINTGVLVAGFVGTSHRQNYTVLGSTVNIGSRLCSLAKMGQIIINQSTYLRVADAVQATKLPVAIVSGIRFPLSIFEVSNKNKRQSDKITET